MVKSRIKDFSNPFFPCRLDIQGQVLCWIEAFSVSIILKKTTAEGLPNETYYQSAQKNIYYKEKKSILYPQAQEVRKPSLTISIPSPHTAILLICSSFL